MKSYRNQIFHGLLDKNLIRDALFQFTTSQMSGKAFESAENQSLNFTAKWAETERAYPVHSATQGVSTSNDLSSSDTPIELKLLEAIRAARRLPIPGKQRAVFKDGRILTVADFVYEDEKIAIYCDGFAYHGTKDKLASDAAKRNELQAQGWLVLTFWGKTILEHSARCEEQIWRAYRARAKTPELL